MAAGPQGPGYWHVQGAAFSGGFSGRAQAPDRTEERWEDEKKKGGIFFYGGQAHTTEQSPRTTPSTTPVKCRASSSGWIRRDSGRTSERAR